MKILLINYEYPPLGGGAANASYYVSKTLSQKGCDITVVTSHFQELKYFENINRVKIIRIPVGRMSFAQSRFIEIIRFAPKAIMEARRLLKQQNYDVVLSYFTIPSGIVGLFLKIFNKLPYVVSLRGADVPGAKGRLLKIYHTVFFPLTLLVWKNASYIIANSQGMYNLVRRIIKLSHLAIIPNAVDSKKFRRGNKEENNRRVLKILYVGRVEKNKGVEDLVSVANYLRFNTKIKYQILIAGDGPEREIITKSVNDLNLSSVFKILGWIPKEEISLYYKIADIFLMPSRYEGMSNAVLEAAASGLPIVGYNIPGNNELINDGYNGFLVDINNFALFKSRVLMLLQNPDMRIKMGANSLDIAKRFQWDDISEKYLDFLKKSVNR